MFRGKWIGDRSVVERRGGGGGGAALFSPVAGFGGAKNRSSARRWFIAKDRWLARRNKAARVPRRPSRERYAPVRAEFSQPSHLATRAPDTNRGCARADTSVEEDEAEKEEEAGHVCTHTRASGVQVIRAISSKFRSNEISRVVVSPSLSISLFVPGFTVYTNSVYTRALLELPASPMVFLTVFIYHGANQHDQRFVLNAIR